MTSSLTIVNAEQTLDNENGEEYSMNRHTGMWRVLLLIAVLSAISGCAKRAQPPTASDDVQVVEKEDFAKLAGETVGEHAESMLMSPHRVEIIRPADELDVIIYEKLPASQDKRIEMKRVNETGTIVIVPVGEIKVAGLSIVDAQKAVEEKLKEFVVSPHCEISIANRGYAPQVYIFGESARTGTIPLKQGDRLVDILAAAGGCKVDAYRRSIKVIRATESKVTMISINLFDIMRQGKLDRNILMKDRDIVFVPRRFFTNLQEVMRVVGMVLPWYYFVDREIISTE